MDNLEWDNTHLDDKDSYFLRKFIAMREEVSDCLNECRATLKTTKQIVYDSDKESSNFLHKATLNLEHNNKNFEDFLTNFKLFKGTLMEESKMSQDFILGKLEGMAQVHTQQMVEILSSIKEVKVVQESIRNDLIEHEAVDAKSFETINLNIAEAKGRIKAIVSIFTLIAAIAGFGYPILSKFMGW